MALTRLELLDLIRNGESSGVEFKRDDIQAADLAKELVAFANFEGGSVLLGVEDDGQVSGIVRGNVEEWVMNACRDKIRPALIPYFELVRDLDGQDVAVVRVTRGYDVHAVWHNGRHIYLTRVGSTNRELSQEELARLFQQRGLFRVELRPVSGASFDDLDLRRLRNYFADVRQQDTPPDDDGEAWRQLLFNTEIMVEDGISVSGILLFGRTPNRFLGHAGIDASAFPGVEKDYGARERAQLRGPMVPLLDQNKQVLDAGLVEQALAFVQRNSQITGTLETGTGRRLEQADYPFEAVREAIVNALIHRDYLLSNTDIELSLYDDRLEIVSPGRLPNGITTERMLTGCRAARNQLIKDVMRDYRYLEHSGMGVPRKIVRSMREQNGVEPDLILAGEQFTVRLWKRGRGPQAA